MGSEVRSQEIINETNVSSFKCKQGWIAPATPEEKEKEKEKEKGEHSISISISNSNSNSISINSSPPTLDTPKETLFDSFAPASDKFLLAPHHRKYREDSRNQVVRRLDFFVQDSTTVSAAAAAEEIDIDIDIEMEEEEEEEEEARLFQIVYSTIMDAIFAEQQPPPTPKSAPLLTGIADTCPAPPTKSARKHRFIDRELCRKLEF